MLFLSHLRTRIRRGHAVPSGQRRRPNRTRLGVESLEHRVVPATSLAFDDYANLAGLDAGGNIYVDGRVEHTADLDTGAGTTWLTADHYVAKYSSDRALLWQASADSLFGAADAQVRDAASFSSGGQDFVYVMEASVSGSRTIARFLDTGAGLSQVWRTDVGGYGNISVGSDGTVYMAGMFNGTVDFAPNDTLPGDTLTSNGQDGFVASWSAAGDFRWARQLGGTDSEWVDDVRVINNGTTDVVYVAGIFAGDFAPDGHGGPALTDQGVTGVGLSQDGYVAAYDAAGGLQSVGHFVDARVQQVAGDAGGVYVAGFFYYPALGFPGNGYEDIFFGKLSASGQSFDWVQTIGGPDADTVGALQVNAGSLYLSGQFSDTVDFDPDGGVFDLTAGTIHGIYVASYTTDGAFRWATGAGSSSFSSSASNSANALAVSGTNLYVGGHVGPGTATFGGDTFVNDGPDEDGVVLKLATDGNSQWAFPIASVVRTIDNGDSDYGESGSGWSDYQSGGLDGDARYHRRGSGSNQAQWSFTDLPEGTYEVLATWPASSKNGTNVTYTIGGASATVNQRVAPTTYDSETRWGLLATIAVGPGGTLTVTLSDAANGNVLADGVRVWMVAPPAPPAPDVTVTPTSGLVTTEAGATASFEVVLSQAPTASVTFAVASDDTTEGTVDASALTFTTENWSTPQTVTITGVDDPDADGDRAYTILVGPASSSDSGYDGLDPADVSVTNLDDEPAPAPTLASLSDSPDPVKQGQTLTLTATVTGTPESISFYRDANGNGNLDVGTDDLLGTDTNGGDGWHVGVGIPGNFPTGMYTYFAQGTFNGGASTTNVATTTGEVIKKGGRSNLLAESAGDSSDARSLTTGDIRPLLFEAINRFAAAGIKVSSLNQVQVRITDLPGAVLGQAAGNIILLDSNAAGWGWFVDPTPGDDSEFITPGDQGEQRRMDLLTVLMHEMGHVLGYGHEADGVMEESLSAGERLTLHGGDLNDYAWLVGLPELTKKRDLLAG